MDGNCSLLLLLLALSVFRSHAVQVFQWQRDWTGGSYTHEFAHVYEDKQQIVHSAADTSEHASVLPSVTFYDYQQRLIAMRPILSNGYQVCFVTLTTGTFMDSLDTLTMRHGATILSSSPARFTLTPVGSGFEPLSLTAVEQFCSVDPEHILYLTPVEEVTQYSKTMRIQGLYHGYMVGIPSDLLPFFDGKGIQ